MKFNMVSLAPSSTIVTPPGPLVDDGAPYSGLGIVELRSLAPCLLPNWDGTLLPVPDSVRLTPFWQYGSGNHASPKRKILGSVMLSAVSDQGSTVEICHLVIDGSSQWLIGRNVTRSCDIKHIGANCLEFEMQSGVTNKISMVDLGPHSYLPVEIFSRTDSSLCSSTFLTLACSVNNARLSWQDTKRLLDKVHRHVCGHSSYNDIKLLLERNEVWTKDCEKYLSSLIENCPDCNAIKSSSGSRKVSLHSMSRGFNEVVSVDHFFSDRLDVLHIMDSLTRYSTGALVASTSMSDAIPVFDTQWMSEFWPPDAIQGDKAFDNQDFKEYLHDYDVAFRPVPPRRHHKNVLESKHRILRDIYLRIKSDMPEKDPRLLVSKMFRISNDLYGNNIASAHELAKGYTRPIASGHVQMLPLEIREAQEQLSAKRKLNLILSSKAVSEIPIRVGDYVQVYVRLPHQKCGKWSATKPVISFDPESRIFTVAGAKGRKVQAAVEDVRHAVVDDALGEQVQAAIDELSSDLDAAFESCSSIDDNSGTSSQRATPTAAIDSDDDFFSDSPFPSSQVSHTGHDVNAPVDESLEELTYVPAQPSNFDPEVASADSLVQEESEETHLSHPHPSAPSQHSMVLRSRSSSRIPRTGDDFNASRIELLPGAELSSIEQDSLGKYRDRFSYKEFLLKQAEGLPAFVLENAYKEEESKFIKECELIHRSKVPTYVNIIRSHVLYKIKTRDDDTLMCKARIAPHGNEDREKEHLRTDSESCPPIGIRLLLSLSTLFKWCLSKIDIKSAFLQSRSASRKVYVVPPTECRNRQFIWLLNVATYGLVNANVKWQKHSDDTFLKLGLETTVYVPQLFYKQENQELVLVVIKIVDDILTGGREPFKSQFIERLSGVYTLGTITHLPGSCLFYGLHVTQDEDCSVTIHADQKLDGITPHQTSHVRRKQPEEVLNAVEQYHYNSVNGSIGFVGVLASPIAAFVSSHLQQKRNNATVRDLAVQRSMLERVCQIGSVSSYMRPKLGSQLQLSVLVFCDAARPSEYGQLGILGGLLLGNLQKGSLFHVLFWSSCLSKRPVKSIGSAEVLAAWRGIDEGILVSLALSVLLHTTVPVIIAVDSKDLYESLSSCHVPEDKSIRCDVQLIRYYFETRQISRMVWLLGSLNLADHLKKKDSMLLESLQLLLFTGELPSEIPSDHQRSSDRSLG